MAEAQKQLQALSETYQALQNDLTTQITTRRTLSSQLTESTSVQTTIAPLTSSNQIYKLVGPVLLKQDKSEATMSVDARVKFIEKEISRVEGLIAETQDKMEEVKGGIIGLQAKMEGGASGASAGVTAG